MRISIPSIPEQTTRNAVQYTLDHAANLVAEFLTAAKGKAVALTGAGVSVDSGIAPYRGEGGHYTIHKTYRPIFYHEFVDPTEKGHIARQRYYARSYLGFPTVRDASSNKSHYSIAAIQHLGYVPDLITQNVDSLHIPLAKPILELHGTLKHVICVSHPEGYKHSDHHNPINPELHSYLRGPRAISLNPKYTPTADAYPGCGFVGLRSNYQDELSRLNPDWARLQREMAETGKRVQTNPDGDASSEGVDYSTFRYPRCPSCNGWVKPGVIFFGETVPSRIRDQSYKLIDDANALLCIGTSLSTYSAFRLVKHAVEQKKPVMILNKGPTRADPLVPDAARIELGSSEVLSRVARLLSNGRERHDDVLRRLLASGVTIRPNEASGVISS